MVENEMSGECQNLKMHEIIIKFHADTLSSEEEQTFFKHLATCEACRNDVYATESALEKIRQKGIIYESEQRQLKAKERSRFSRILIGLRKRKIETFAIAASTLAALTLGFGFSLWRPKNASPFEVALKIERSGEDALRREAPMEAAGQPVFHTGDHFNIVFKSTQDAFVYILRYDPKGELSLVFPSPGIELSNSVKVKEEIVLPPEGSFRLTGDAGQETIFLLASRRPIDIDKILVEAKEAASDSRITRDRRIQSFLEVFGRYSELSKRLHFRHERLD